MEYSVQRQNDGVASIS